MVSSMIFRMCISAISLDAQDWTFHPMNAYDNNVTLSDGTAWPLSRRERPKLILDAEGEITHLINGVSLPGEANGCDHSGDHTFTFVQPVNTA